jgi:hypothetical protein
MTFSGRSKKVIILTALAVTFLTPNPAFAYKLLFQNDNFSTVESNGITLDQDNTAADITIQFGTTLAEFIKWNNTSTQFDISDDLNFSDSTNNHILNFEIENVAALPGGAGGLGATGTGREVQLTSTDTTAPGCTVAPNCAAGTYTWDGTGWNALDNTSPFLVDGAFAAGAGANNNINIGAATYIRITQAAAFSITGITGGTSGKIIVLRNVSDSDMTIANENAGSTAANRIKTFNGGDYHSNGQGTVTLVYDPNLSRWVISTRDAYSPYFDDGAFAAGAGANNNVNVSNNTYVRVTQAADYSITGIAGGYTGKLLVLRNTGTSNMTLDNENVGSTAANRIHTFTGSDVTIKGEGTAMLFYDSTLARWVASDVTDNTGNAPSYSEADFAATTGNNNNINIGTATYVRLNQANTFTVTGVTGGVGGKTIVLRNTSMNNCIFTNEDALSTSANRIHTQIGGQITLNGDGSVTLVYDSVLARWIVTAVQQ